MSSEQITIKDIARKLNIAPSTVSRALKDHPDISQSTKKAVLDLAQKLDYQPNTVAQGLRKSKTYTIGVIVPEIVHYFFSSVISGIEEVAYDRDFHVMICQSNENFQREVMITRALMRSRVEGILVSISKNTTDFSHFQTLIDRGIPIVFYDRNCDQIRTSSVVVEDYEGAFSATEHLIDIGAKKIIHLCGPERLEISANRIKGFRDAILSHNLPFDEKQLVRADTYKNGYLATKKILQQSDRPDAIFAVNDLTAIGAMKAVKDAGLTIPDDVAIVGFSDDPTLTEVLDPPLSSVNQPGFEMGKVATELLFKKINGESGDSVERKTLKTNLIIRGSSNKKLNWFYHDKSGSAKL